MNSLLRNSSSILNFVALITVYIWFPTQKTFPCDLRSHVLTSDSRFSYGVHIFNRGHGNVETLICAHRKFNETRNYNDEITRFTRVVSGWKRFPSSRGRVIYPFAVVPSQSPSQGWNKEKIPILRVPDTKYGHVELKYDYQRVICNLCLYCCVVTHCLARTN